MDHDSGDRAGADGLRILAQAAAKLITMLGDRAAADLAAFEQAYRLGFAAGLDVGRAQVDNELIALDKRRQAYIHGLNVSAEIEARRWDGDRQTFGRPRPDDFPGFGADYEPPSGDVPGTVGREVAA